MKSLTNHRRSLDIPKYCCKNPIMPRNKTRVLHHHIFRTSQMSVDTGLIGRRRKLQICGPRLISIRLLLHVPDSRPGSCDGLYCQWETERRFGKISSLVHSLHPLLRVPLNIIATEGTPYHGSYGCRVGVCGVSRKDYCVGSQVGGAEWPGLEQNDLGA